MALGEVRVGVMIRVLTQALRAGEGGGAAETPVEPHPGVGCLQDHLFSIPSLALSLRVEGLH